MWIWRKQTLCTLLLGMLIGAALWKTVWRYLKKLKTELQYDSAILFMDVYLIKTKRVIWKGTLQYPSVHSCIIYNSQTWEHPKCPSTHEWMKKWFIYTHTHTHTMRYYSVIRKEEIFAICSSISGLEGIMLNEMSEKDKYFMLSLICGI